MASKLAAALRAEKGKYQIDVLRNEKQVPGNIYGKGKEALSVSFSRNDIESIIRNSQREIEIELDGQVLEVSVCEIQYFPTGTYPIHVDFLYR